ncbi:hypothetical protein AB0758_32790, partial [Tolypothrix bouteillei VB521301_2]|uniref:hypothetical protein n=1 Tax=Tolypothrix bouteillei TaxID=1246981 RepID=UPI0038B434DF
GVLPAANTNVPIPSLVKESPIGSLFHCCDSSPVQLSTIRERQWLSSFAPSSCSLSLCQDRFSNIVVALTIEID